MFSRWVTTNLKSICNKIELKSRCTSSVLYSISVICYDYSCVFLDALHVWNTGRLLRKCSTWLRATVMSRSTLITDERIDRKYFKCSKCNHKKVRYFKCVFIYPNLLYLQCSHMQAQICFFQ